MSRRRSIRKLWVSRSRTQWWSVRVAIARSPVYANSAARAREAPLISNRKIPPSWGMKTAASEIEAVLSQHPAVDDCAVFGIPDDEWGEQVKAAVTLRSGQSADADALIAFCREHIGAYKCPRTIEFIDEMPREASGKLKKRLLRDPYWAGRSRSI